MKLSPSFATEANSGLTDALEKFKGDGYCILLGAFDCDTIQGCQVQLADAKSQQKSCVYDLIESDTELFLTLAANSAVLDFCESVMGPFVQLDGLTIVGLPARDSDGNRRVAGWHRDPWGHVPRSSAFERPLAINALLYLQDLNEETGPVRVIPGSHREPLTMMSDQRRLRHEREDPVYLRAGEIILIHNNLVHTGTSPAPHVRERAFVSIFYNLSWLKQTQLFEGPCATALKEKFRRTDRRLLRLLGEDTTLIQRNDTGFLDDEESQWSLWMKEDRLSRR